jgi:hypothetical protein
VTSLARSTLTLALVAVLSAAIGFALARRHTPSPPPDLDSAISDESPDALTPVAVSEAPQQHWLIRAVVPDREPGTHIDHLTAIVANLTNDVCRIDLRGFHGGVVLLDDDGEQVPVSPPSIAPRFESTYIREIPAFSTARFRLYVPRPYHRAERRARFVRVEYEPPHDSAHIDGVISVKMESPTTELRGGEIKPPLEP